AGAHDPDCRRSFPPATDWNQRLLTLHKELIALRGQHPALCTGAYQTVLTAGDLYAFARSNDQETVVVLVNTAEQTAQATLPTLQEQAVVLWGEGTIAAALQQVSVPPRSGLIIGMSN
ncbi:MAG: DUF3459 domain-containing protein, partial [Cyanobacteria bacterium P01_A01_bin.15]